MTRAVYDLPWPPSANNSKMPISVRSKKTGRQVQRQVSTPELKAYKKTVQLLARAQRQPRVEGIVHATIEYFPPNKIRRDIANLEKAPIDALVEAGAFADDCLIDHLELIRHRHRLVKGGRIRITIEPMTPEGALL